MRKSSSIMFYSSPYKRELSRTRQAFKMPRVSRRSKPSKIKTLQTLPEGRQLDVWTVCSARVVSDMTIVKQSVAWAEPEPSVEDMTQTVVQRLYGRRLRGRFRGTNKDDIEFHDLNCDLPLQITSL